MLKYTVEGLFGDQKHAFQPDKSGVTLLTGPNGSGKSTVLRTLNSVGTGSWLELQRLPFRRVAMKFDNRSTLVIERTEDTLHLQSEEGNWEFEPNKLARVDLDEVNYRLERQIHRTSPREYEFEGRAYSRRELELALSVRTALEDEDALWVSRIPEWFPVLYITDQRLIVQPDQIGRRSSAVARRTVRIRRVVDEYAETLSFLISRGMARYAATSQNLDRVFPRKVIEAIASEDEITLDEVAALLSRVSHERSILQDAGMLESSAGSVDIDESRLIDPQVRRVMRVFLTDALEKFHVLDQLRARVVLFTRFLNQHYEGKHVEVSPADGFTIRLDSGETLQASNLSSGEQQMLVLAYQLLFERDPGTLVLIDEPELSLHVLWQATLVEDLIEMGAASGLYFILATHSPTLIGARDDLTRSLARSGKR